MKKATNVDKITIEEVDKLAILARVGLTEEEKKSLSEQMTEILGFAKSLDEVDVSSVEPTSQVIGLENVFREDKMVRSAISREELLKNAPQSEKGFIKVKSVLE